MTVTPQRGNDVLSTPFCKGYISFSIFLRRATQMLQHSSSPTLRSNNTPPPGQTIHLSRSPRLTIRSYPLHKHRMAKYIPRNTRLHTGQTHHSPRTSILWRARTPPHAAQQPHLNPPQLGTHVLSCPQPTHLLRPENSVHPIHTPE